MSTVLPREEAVETIFSKILASPEASGRLSGVFYDHIDDDHRLTDNTEIISCRYCFMRTRTVISVHCCWNYAAEVCLTC